MKAPIVVLEPGDRVLVNLPVRDLTHQDAQDINDQLSERFPGVEFTVLAAAEVVVQPQTSDGAGAAGHVADDAADEEPLGSGDETAPSDPKEKK